MTASAALDHARSNIKTSVASVSDCSQATVQAVRRLLSGPGPKKPLTGAELPKTSARTKKSGSKVVSARKEPKVVSSAKSRFSQSDRVSIAEDVVTGVLQALCEATKNTSAQNPWGAGRGGAVKTSGAILEVPLNGAPHARSATLGQDKYAHNLEQTLNDSRNALEAVAECGLIAFEFLQSIRSQRTEQKPTLDWNVENGMLAYLGRLVTLRRIDLAMPGLKLFKSILDTRNAPQTVALLSSGESFAVAEPQDALMLYDMLCFDGITFNCSNLPVIIAFQLLVLRSTAVHSQIVYLEKLAERLDLPSHHSPFNLIHKLAQLSGDTQRAALQMEQLSQLIFHLCPRSPCTKPKNGKITSQQPSNIISMWLQAFAFRCRLSWMELAGHSGDLEQEVIQPFAKNLTAYCSAVSLKSSPELKILRTSVELVKHGIIDSSFNARTKAATEQSLERLHQLVQDIIVTPRSEDEKPSLSPPRKRSFTKPITSSAAQCSNACHIAAAKVKRYPDASDTTWFGAITEVLKMVKHQPDGPSEEVDRMISDVLRLRNLTTQVAKSNVSNEMQTSSSALLETIKCFRDLSESSVRLLLQFSPSFESKPSRKLLISKAAPSSIECVLWYLAVSSQQPQKQSEEDFLKRKLVLDDCVQLMQATQQQIVQTEENETTNKIQTPSLPVRLSHAYFEIHLKAKEQCSDLSKDCLERSIDTLHNAPLSDKNKGNLLMKLDRISKLFYHHGQSEKARDSLIMLIDTSCKLQILTSSLWDSFAPLPTIFLSNAQTKLLADAIRLLLDIQARCRGRLASGNLFWDDDSLEPSHRGLLLEWQLHIISGWTTSKTLWARGIEMASPLVQVLFDIYGEFQFRFQRQRLSLLVLNLETDVSGCLDSSVIESARDCANDCLIAPESELSPYCSHLRSALEVAIALQDLTLRADLLKSAVTRWSRLVETRHSWDDLCSVIGDIHAWFQQLEYLLAFLQARGCSLLQLSVLKLLLQAHQFRGDRITEDEFRASVEIGLQLLRLGYSELGGLFLAKAKDELVEDKIYMETQIEYHHGYAEYFLELGEYSKSREHLDHAQNFLANEISSPPPRRPLTPHTKVVDICRNSDSLHLRSRLSSFQGSFLEAFWCGVGEFNLLQSVWKGLESRVGESKHEQSARSNSSLQSLTEGLSALSISKPNLLDEKYSSATFYGSRFWPLIPRICRSAIHLSQLCYLGGSSQDAFYFLDQARKVAEASKADQLLSKIVLHKGDMECRQGDLTNGWKSLELSQNLLCGLEVTIESVLLHQSMGHFYHLTNDLDSEMKEYRTARIILSDLIRFDDVKQFHPNSGVVIPQKNIEPEMRSTKETDKGATRLRKTSRKEHHGVVVNHALSPANSLNKEGYFLLKNRGKYIDHLEAYCLLQGGDLSASSDILSVLEEGGISIDWNIEYRLLKSTLLLHEATDILSTNSIFGMLTESAVSIPAAIPPTKQVSTKLATRHEDQRPKPNSNQLSHPVKTVKSHSPITDQFGVILHQTIHTLVSKGNETDRLASLSGLRKKASTLGTASFLLSAVQNSLSESSTNPLTAVPFIDYPQYLSSLREQAITHVDRLSKEAVQRFGPPRAFFCDSSEINGDYAQTYEEFSSSLPPSWNAISLTLDEGENHLHVTRHRTHSKPFALRLPLERTHSEDPDEESFSFEEAKAELTEIVRLSDATVHAARTDALMFKKKGSRSEWWAERETLDTRMHNLLLNIENMWLGGFCGVFFQPFDIPELVSRFQKSFEVILDNNLPSRQRSHKRQNKTKVQLDPQIFELFLGLAHCSHTEDLEEQLTDLLYFVIDVLQFNGEANAYDEIDFDSIIVDTQEALKSFQDSLPTIQTNELVPHTILLLDKRLHGFPWECLPCLDGQSISRAYSITEIQERISMMRSQRTNKDVTGVYASPLNGSYILNPSQDLEKTQKRFERALSGLCTDPLNWTGITGRPPTESEFALSLYKPSTKEAEQSRSLSTPTEQSHNILLYFGHGSGAQYIRHRRIKQTRFEHQRLQEQVTSIADSRNCSSSPISSEPNTNVSVSLLFGCSSASLSDNFEFEPHGTPKSYMLAGSPALLGSLWDITDGDLDKFASGVLERWGLFERGTFEDLRVASGRVRGKGKARPKTSDNEGRTQDDALSNMSLSQAVAKSRSECYLKYLNGAAMVVYGVPVFLETS